MSVHVSDHALLRFLQRAGGLDVEAVRRTLGQSLERASRAALALGQNDYTIRADGMIYIVSAGRVVTAMDDMGQTIVHHGHRNPERAST
jgi:hypothetical protein